MANALLAALGYGASETTAALARALESASDKDAPERLATDNGLWVGSLIRAEASLMRAHTETFVRDVEVKPESPEAGVAHRAAGLTHWSAGEYAEARMHLERALTLFQPGRDDDLAFRFGNDAGVAAMFYLALTLWPLDYIARAVSLIGEAGARSAGLAHIASRAQGNPLRQAARQLHGLRQTRRDRHLAQMVKSSLRPRPPGRRFLRTACRSRRSIRHIKPVPPDDSKWRADVLAAHR
jgi:hypothetical protein